MLKDTIYIVSEKEELGEKAKALLQSLRNYGYNIDVQVCSQEEYNMMKEYKEKSALYPGQSGRQESWGNNPQHQENNVIPFPEQKQVSSIVDMEKEAIRNAIVSQNGNLTRAAKVLKIGRATLYRKVKLYGLDISNFRKKVA